MTDHLSQVLNKVVQDLFDVSVEPVFTRPDEQFGDYATNVALKLAGQLGKNPREVAEQVADKLKDHEAILDVQVAGPGFVNIRVSSSVLAKTLHENVGTALDSYGSSTVGAGKTVICEFPSPNMAKPFSVGHIRSALQGWAVHKLMLKMGYTVITDNHLGDSGTPFGKWVVGYLTYSSEERLNELGISELSRIYIAMTADLKAEEAAGGSEIAEKVQQWLKKLESGDPEAIHYSEWFNRISLDHMHQVLGRIKVSTEFELGESQFVARGQEIVNDLLEKGVAVESEGAIIVELDEFGIDTPIMLRKANGAALYATTDLATIEYREKNWSPDKVFIHTGQEQAFYFRQLNALAQKCGYRPVIEHLWHGLVDQKNDDGTREKMSSRKGVILLNDLIDRAEEKAREGMTQGGDSDVQAVALAAIKFTDFTADRKKGVLFDWDTMFSVHGFSGPAVQYSVVRIKSIKNKAGDAPQGYDATYDWQDEHKLLIKVSEYPDLLLSIHENYELHRLAAYLYELARELNRYYENTPILNASEVEKSSRLWLLSTVEYVLEQGLDILGIPTPQEM